MKDNTIKKLVVICIIWWACLLALFWNVEKINEIRELKIESTLLDAKERFLKQNLENVSKAVKEKEAFYQLVESLGIGLLKVEDDIASLAAGYGLSRVKLEHDDDRESSCQARIALSCEGYLWEMVKFMDGVKKKYSSIYFTEMKIRMDGSGTRGKLDLFMICRFKTI